MLSRENSLSNSSRRSYLRSSEKRSSKADLKKAVFEKKTAVNLNNLDVGFDDDSIVGTGVISYIDIIEVTQSFAMMVTLETSPPMSMNAVSTLSMMPCTYIVTHCMKK